MRIGGAQSAPPPSQTGRADLPHPAFQSAAADGLAQVGVPRCSEGTHQPRNPHGLAHPVTGGPLPAGPPRPSGFPTAPTRTALRHYVGPCEMASIRLPTLPSCLPSLHDHYSLLRYYGGSDPDRPFRHPLPWFPDSRHQNFPSFCLQPSAVLDQTRSTASTLIALFCSGFALRSQARQNRRPNRVHSVRPCRRTLLRTDSSLPVALHPGVLPRCSYFQLLALQCRPGQGLSPCCSSALSGARAPVSKPA
jgi:hypothetical protein